MAKRKASTHSPELKALIDEMVEPHMILSLNEIITQSEIDENVVAEFRACWAALQGYDTEAGRRAQALLATVLADAQRRGGGL